MNQLQENLLEDLRYERDMSSLILELSNLNFFVGNSNLTGVTLNAEFISIFTKCAEKISHLDLSKLSDYQLNRVIESAP